MRNDPEEGHRLKRQLPYPYNQDLSKVLHGLKRRNPITRRRQANDPVTAAYLYAGVQLIRRHLGPGAVRTPGDAGDPDSVERPLLGFLSQRAVAAEVNHNPPPLHCVGSTSTLRKRWEPQSNFIADVLRFGLWPWHYPAAHLDEVADAKEEVLRGPDPVRRTSCPLLVPLPSTALKPTVILAKTDLRRGAAGRGVRPARSRSATACMD